MGSFWLCIIINVLLFTLERYKEEWMSLFVLLWVEPPFWQKRLSLLPKLLESAHCIGRPCHTGLKVQKKKKKIEDLSQYKVMRRHV